MPTPPAKAAHRRHRGCGGAERVERHLRSAPRDLANAGRSIGVPARVVTFLGAGSRARSSAGSATSTATTWAPSADPIITADKPTPRTHGQPTTHPNRDDRVP